MAGKANLPHLFEQIIESEEHAERRHAHITKVNADINARDCEIQAIKSAIEELQSQLIVTEKQCIKEQCEAEISEIKLQSLLKEEKSIEESIKSLKNEVELKNQRDNEERELFLQEMKDFCDKYDPFTKNGEFRKAKRAEKLESLKVELQNSKDDLEDVLNQDKSIKTMIQNQTTLQQEINKLQRDVIDTDLECENYREKVIEAKQKIENSFQSTSNDPEFVRLQKELNKYDGRQAEESLHILRAQLQKLKREEWQYELNIKPRNKH